MQKYKKRGYSTSLKTKKASSKRLPKITSSSHRQQKKEIKRYLRRKRSVIHRVVLQPITLVFLIVIGVLIVGATYEAIADDITVTATVPAPPLTSPATITYPTDGSVLTSSPITVTGSCPNDSYVELYQNSLMDGEAICSAEQSYAITTSLFIGTNTFVAQDYNITDMAGPAGQSVTVSYSPPQPPVVITPAHPSSPSSSSPTILPLVLITTYHYQTTQTNTPFTSTITVKGGVGPYTINVNWKDGSSSTQTLTKPGSFTITHTYKTAGYYPILVTVTDSSGQSDVVQIAGLVQSPGSKKITPISPITTGPSETQLSPETKNWLIVAWPAYVVAALIVFTFYLGERQELLQITKTLHKGHRK